MSLLLAMDSRLFCFSLLLRIGQDVGAFLSNVLTYALEDRSVTIWLTLQDELVPGEVHGSAPFLR